ncbi:MAG: amino acid ABC transporter permease, partial [Alphaproteobacteria bacterium]
MSDQSFTGPPKEPFRIEQLWVDTRYRSTFIQIIALGLLMLVFGWLVSNVIQNFEDLGKDFSFKFLSDPASYDINQRLIEYTSRSPHWKAAVVGILNTLLVAFLGCVAATVIGVIAGVLRLSKNWVIARLMTVYIEGVRNVPLLLQILMWYTIFINVLPKPKQADPTLWGFLVPTNRGFYIPGLTYENGAGAVGIVLLLSIVGIFVFRRWAKKRQEATGQILPVFLISVGLFIVPALLTQLALGSPIGLDFPELKGFNYKGGIYMRSSLIALWFALSLYTGAFIAENVRSGILAVSHGQSEAAGALGLRPNRTMNLVVLPQA